MMDCGTGFKLCDNCKETYAPPDKDGKILCWPCFVEDAALDARDVRRKSVEAAGKSFVSRHGELLRRLAKTEGRDHEK